MALTLFSGREEKEKEEEEPKKKDKINETKSTLTQDKSACTYPKVYLEGTEIGSHPEQFIFLIWILNMLFSPL